MNIFIRYEEGGLGDSLSLLTFAHDFSKQRPDDSLLIEYGRSGVHPSLVPYFRQREQIFGHSGGTLVKYDGQPIHKTVDLRFPVANDICWATPSGNDVITGILQRPYAVFRRNGIEVEQTMTYVPFAVTDNEKSVRDVMFRGKPIALINCGYHSLVSCKNWGVARYQELVDSLKDRIDFIQIGERVLNGFRHVDLTGTVANMVNHTDVSQLAGLMYGCDFVFNNVTGSNLMASIPSYRTRHVFTMCGRREPANYAAFSGPHLNVHSMVGKEEHKECEKPGRGACWCQRIDECPMRMKLSGGDVVAKCMSEITVDMVVAEVKKCLNNWS